uniref:Uncharacterized protein n=1 Tax=Peronospora matthiolae TaxID=2874970 RepID=A0AAV1U4D1_9STRA
MPVSAHQYSGITVARSCCTPFFSEFLGAAFDSAVIMHEGHSIAYSQACGANTAQRIPPSLAIVDASLVPGQDELVLDTP